MARSNSHRRFVSNHRSPPTVAATLIVRDEARCIARCLESVRPHVDRIILVDTGSTDGTIDIARALGAEVHSLAWPNDFSIARNHALTIADADWNLIIDADEWLLSGGDGLKRWCDGPARLGRICQHNRSDHVDGSVADGPLPASRNWVTRILPRGVRYEGRVHEQAVSTLPRERLDIHLGHDGYLRPQLSAKQGRNQTLLQLELHDRPDDSYILYQLGKEAEGRGEFAEATRLFDRSRSLAPAAVGWNHELLIRLLHCLGRSGRVEEALALAGQNMQDWSHSPDFFFVLGNLLLDRAISDPRQALAQWLPLACSAWEQCLELGESPDLEGSVTGRGSHLAQHNLDAVRSQIALLAA
jgi:pentatricopeptide repeat protein